MGLGMVPLCPLSPQPLVAPVAVTDSLDRVRREFEFNISASHRFDVNLNASKTLNEVALDIMEEVHVRMQPTSELLGIFTHVSFVAILYVYLQ